MRTGTVVAAAALIAGGVATPSWAQDSFAVSDLQVTPVLADYPYQPVLDGSVNDGSLELVSDPDDCSITGLESHGDFGGNGIYAEKGCGGAKITFKVTRNSDVAYAFAGASARATATYGCVNKQGKTRELFTTRQTLPGKVGLFEIPFVLPGDNALGVHITSPLETVACRKSENPAELSLTVDHVVVTISAGADYGAIAPVEVHDLPGSWSVSLPLPSRPGHAPTT
jgi:hypothetical protein